MSGSLQSNESKIRLFCSISHKCYRITWPRNQYCDNLDCGKLIVIIIAPILTNEWFEQVDIFLTIY